MKRIRPKTEVKGNPLDTGKYETANQIENECLVKFDLKKKVNVFY